MSDGWVKIHRCIQENWIWQEPVKLKWWLDLILLANHKEKKVLIGDELIKINRGSYHTSELKLAERWGADRKTVRKFLDLLEKDGMIEVEKSRKLGTTIKVSNYDNYQQTNENNAMDNSRDNKINNKMDNDITKEMDNGMDMIMDNGRVIDMNNHRDINKKEKKDKNEKKEKNVNNEKNMKSGSGCSVYETFESNGFGLLSPVMVDIIKDLVETYGEQWVNDAVLVAVASGKRNLKYVQGILKNWLANGRDDERGEFKDGSIKQNIKGASGKWERNSYTKQGGWCKENGFNNGEWTNFKPEEPKLSGDLCCEGLI